MSARTIRTHSLEEKAQQRTEVSERESVRHAPIMRVDPHARSDLPRFPLLTRMQHLTTSSSSGSSSSSVPHGRFPRRRPWPEPRFGKLFDFLLVRLVARRAGPPVACLRFRGERRVDAAQVENLGTASASDRVGADKSRGQVVSALGRGSGSSRLNPAYKAAHLQQTEHPRCASHSSDPVPTSHSTNSKPSWRCFKTSAAIVSRARDGSQRQSRIQCTSDGRRDAPGAFCTL